ncbi:MAG: GDP-L-fucose synthase [Frankiaceae bacterium]|nr:GDP-L-fucose synthase [Frankiaceae bacterium]
MRVLVTGAGGMVGRALVARLHQPTDAELLTPRRDELDLLDRAEVARYFTKHQPDVVIHAAGRVGGIADNIADPVTFLRDNAAMGINVVGSALDTGVARLLNIGSSCMYPRDWRQPLVEEDLLQGALEPTNEGYAIAKIMTERLCRYAAADGKTYRTVIPSNLYGPHDHFEAARAHLVAAAIAKVHRAKTDRAPTVEVWGDGTARREFTYVDDLATWVSQVLGRLEELPVAVNAGSGTDHSVREYYELISDVVGYDGELTFDTSRPVGMRQKLMDSSLAAAAGWRPATSLADGLRQTYSWYLEHAAPSASGVS